MEKSLSALSVDNSLLDPIHPFSNSNSEKFPTPYTLSVPILSQTNKQAGRYDHDTTFTRTTIRTRTYTNPRNKPVTKGNGRRYARVFV